MARVVFLCVFALFLPCDRAQPAPTPAEICSPAFAQCGGTEWEGPTCCVDGCQCVETDEFYSQCDIVPTLQPSEFKLRPTPQPQLPSLVPTLQPSREPTSVPSWIPLPTQALLPTADPTSTPTSAPSKKHAATDEDSCVPYPSNTTAARVDRVEFAIGLFTVGVLVISAVAAYLHFKAASGRFSNVTWFHITHTAFCSTYASFTLTLYYVRFGSLKVPFAHLCLCDSFNMMLTLYALFFAILWSIFLRYWKKALLPPGSTEECWQVRVVIYATLSVGYIVLYAVAINKEPCNKDNFNIWRDVPFGRWVCCGAVTVVCDSTILALLCMRRLREQSARVGLRSTRAKWQTALFVLLPVSMLLAFIAPNIYETNGSEYFFLVPSTLALFLMCGRNFISLADKNRDNLDGFWSELLPGDQQYVSLFGGDLPKPNVNNSDEVDYDSATATNDSILLSSIPPPIHSHLAEQKKEHIISDFKVCQTPSLTATIVTLGNPSSLVVDEFLEPPKALLSFVGMYLRSVIVPKLELAFRIHLKRVDALIEARSCPEKRTDKESSSEDLEKHRQQLELERRCDGLTQKFAEFITMIKVTSDTMLQDDIGGSSGGCVRVGGVSRLLTTGAYKPSRYRKVLSMSHITTNLFMYSATLQNVGSSRATTRHSLDKSVDQDAEVLASISFGAPAAHSLGFAFGGLRATLLKLEREVLEVSRGSREVQSREASLQQLELRFDAKARESVVMSQALGGAVSATIDWLTRAITERKGLKMQQVGRIGLLLHSVALLSTSGQEGGMLDDFIGAYDDLELNVRFECDESKAADATFNGAGELLSVRRIQSTDSEDIEPAPAPASVASNAASQVADQAEDVLQDDSSSRESFLLSKFASPTMPKAAMLQVPLLSPADTAPPPIPTRRPSFTGPKDGHCRGASMGRITVTLRVSAQADFDWLALQLGIQTPRIRVVPVLFNLGINEIQTVANAARFTGIQNEINRASLIEIRAYHREFTKASTNETNSHAGEVQRELYVLLDRLEELIEAEAKERTKTVDLLLVSCFIARLLNGALTISCESAKDTTAMFQTLEVARFAERNQMVEREKVQLVLDSLRGEDGVRLRNCELNVEKPKYSFSQLQLQALPAELRPPLTTT